MNNIIHLDIPTRHPLPAKEMLSAIAENNPKHAFVICWDEEENLPTYHSTTGDMPVVLMRLREFEFKYFNKEFIGEQK